MSQDSRTKRASTRFVNELAPAAGLRRRMVLGGTAAVAAWSAAPLACAPAWPRSNRHCLPA